MRRQHALTEAECYVRCYGSGEPRIRILRREPRRESPAPSGPSGEELRKHFEDRLDAREPEAA